MIKCDYFKTRKDGVVLVRTYSDENKKILQLGSGIKYDEAIDVGESYIENGETKYRATYYEYAETNEDIEVVEEGIEKEEAVNEDY